ncbi:TPA: hypothetical protein PEP05_000809 [Vibrio parahaemolyticus]|nr:hypothetical protein [Vibrio parahaemolyticus]
MSKIEWRDFVVSKPVADWHKKATTTDKGKVKTRRKIEEIEEERRLKKEFEL